MHKVTEISDEDLYDGRNTNGALDFPDSNLPHLGFIFLKFFWTFTFTELPHKMHFMLQQNKLSY